MASIVQRKGKYCVVYLYTNDEGKRKQKWETYKTYDEAKKRRAEVEYRAQIGKLVMPKCVTMEDLIREFIANYGKNKWALSTYQSNVGMLEHYVIPQIGKVKLKDITPMILERFYQSLLTTKAEVALPTTTACSALKNGADSGFNPKVSSRWSCCTS